MRLSRSKYFLNFFVLTFSLSLLRIKITMARLNFFKQLIKTNIDGKHTPISKLSRQAELKVIRIEHTQFFDVGKMSLY